MLSAPARHVRALHHCAHCTHILKVRLHRVNAGTAAGPGTSCGSSPYAYDVTRPAAPPRAYK
jgi:hypothetical protein